MTKQRCPWCLGSEEYIAYHDTEWGVPVFDDRVLFEFLLLESAQAGLSRRTILAKRAGYRDAFYGFDPKKVASMSEEECEALRENPRIVRNKRKIYAAVNNARVFLAIQEEFGSFSSYVWSFVDSKQIRNNRTALAQCPVTTPISDALSKDLKKRGMKFVGSTTMYAYMQAVGLVDDHLVSCFVRRDNDA